MFCQGTLSMVLINNGEDTMFTWSVLYYDEEKNSSCDAQDDYMHLFHVLCNSD